jgi:hypothetical protein
VIDQARLLRPYAFGVMDILKNEKPTELFDIVVGNGIFYLIREDPYEYMFRLVQRMMGMSRDAVIFNALNTRHTGINGEFVVDHQRIMNWGEGLGLRMVVRTDYLPHDFTVGIYK